MRAAAGRFRIFDFDPGSTRKGCASPELITQGAALAKRARRLMLPRSSRGNDPIANRAPCGAVAIERDPNGHKPGSR
jgi:hypothetical protein